MTEKNEVVEGVESVTKVVVEREPIELPEVPNIRFIPAEGQAFTTAEEETIEPITDTATKLVLIGDSRSKKAILIASLFLAGYSKSEIVRHFKDEPFIDEAGIQRPIPFQVIFPIWTKLKNAAETKVVTTAICKPARVGADGLTTADRKALKAAQTQEEKAKNAAAKIGKKAKTSGQQEAELLAKETADKVIANKEASEAADIAAVAKL